MDLKKINELLADGLSMTKVEKQLGYGKDTLRKKLNRHGYKFNKETKQYELICDTQLHITSGVTSPHNSIQEAAVTEVVTPSYPQTFTENQLSILHKIIKEYQARETIQCGEGENRGTLKNRNVRVYVEQYDQFSDWCKINNLTQADALYKAISLLMNSIE